jgi:hypothetical protein
MPFVAPNNRRTFCFLTGGDEMCIVGSAAEIIVVATKLEFDAPTTFAYDMPAPMGSRRNSVRFDRRSRSMCERCGTSYDQAMGAGCAWHA